MRFALIGYPIDYSLSPFIHQQFAAQFDVKMDYHLIPTEIENLSAVIKQLISEQYLGINVTQPHKQSILKYVNHQSDTVKKVKAANTIAFREDEIHAYNTDGKGFYNAIKYYVGSSLENKNILLIGAGGVAKSILPELIKLNASTIKLLNRSVNKSQDLLREYQGVALYQANDNYDYIINATTLAYYQLPVNFPHLEFRDKIIFDSTYAHQQSKCQRFMKLYQPEAVYNGVAMLVEQAACAFTIWHGLTPEIQPVLKNIERYHATLKYSL